LTIEIKQNEMATKLLKKVERELVYTDRGKTLIVALEPGDLITFRHKGKRTHYSVSLHNVQLLALMGHLREKYNDRMEKYKVDKAAGRKVRKPKPLSYAMFNKFYQEVMSYQRKD
jgi:hypothetical protein